MRLFGLFRNPAKRYARELGPFLAKNWGASTHYTQGQIQRAVRELRLDPDYSVFGYAAFMSEDNFEKLRGTFTQPMSFQEARATLERFALPRQPSSANGTSMSNPVEVSSASDFHWN